MNTENILDGRLRTITICLFLLLITYLVPVVFPLQTAPYWEEDGVIESIGALFFLMSSLFLFATFLRSRKKIFVGQNKYQALWILALGFLFFVAFGEEISWGQRIFNFATPESIREINEQKEFNLHNLNFVHGENKTGIAALFTSHRLFYGLLIGYMILIPLIMQLNVWPQRLITLLQLPVTPSWIGIIFFLALFLVKIIQFLFAKNNPDLYHGLVEIMETNIAFVTSLLGWAFYRSELFKGKSTAQ